ncbi:hypothetical protein MTO96_052270, partial [Rhipicephalus appendiculatus]
VRQGRDVNARTFSYIGQIEHDDTSEPPLADHALVFMFVPFADSYTQPVGVFASRGPTKGGRDREMLLRRQCYLDLTARAVFAPHTCSHIPPKDGRLHSGKRCVEDPPSAMKFSVLPIVLSLASCASSVIVNTNEGPLQGRTVKVLDKEIQVFLGIPYAKPPVGSLRFNKPQAPQPWQGIYDATCAKDSCVQRPGPGPFDIPTGISEDCLYLNLWTPLASTQEGFPVLVWFHGGMFQVGSAYEERYNGSALAALNDVVVVSCNFRLSVLGFLDLNHTLTPGNLALWDQRAALQWVQRNVWAFGGNPGSVTVFGESSGAMLLHGHILSPP